VSKTIKPEQSESGIEHDFRRGAAVPTPKIISSKNQPKIYRKKSSLESARQFFLDEKTLDLQGTAGKL
jgi:hypothetical protein